MTEELRKTIKEDSDNWAYDEESKAYAFELGKFLYGFMAYLDSLNMSERTLRAHKDNVYAIGILELQYGYRDEEPFKLENFAGGASYDYEYSYKVSNSPTSINRYCATWNYIDKYIKTKAYLKFHID